MGTQRRRQFVPTAKKITSQYDARWDYLNKKVYYTDGSGDWYRQYVYDSNANHSMVSGAGAKLTPGKFNDSICIGGTSVIIFGGKANDKIYNDASIVTIDGGANNDYIYNSDYAKSSKILGGAGNDEIYNNGSNSKLDAGVGNDSVKNYASQATINGGAGVDTIYSHADSVKVGDGDDTIEGFSMKDRLVLDISKATYSEKYIGKDILITFGKGTILLKGAVGNLDLTDFSYRLFSAEEWRLQMLLHARRQLKSRAMLSTT